MPSLILIHTDYPLHIICCKFHLIWFPFICLFFSHILEKCILFYVCICPEISIIIYSWLCGNYTRTSKLPFMILVLRINSNWMKHKSDWCNIGCWNRNVCLVVSSPSTRKNILGTTFNHYSNAIIWSYFLRRQIDIFGFLGWSFYIFSPNLM